MELPIVYAVYGYRDGKEQCVTTFDKEYAHEVAAFFNLICEEVFITEEVAI